MWKKNRIIRKNSLVGFWVMISCLAFNHPILAQSLSDLVTEALEQNYQIQIMRNMETMAQNSNTVGNAGFLPSASVRADQLWGVQNTEQNFFNGDSRSGNNARSARLDAFLEVNWTVFDGFRMFATRYQLRAISELSAVDTRYYIEQSMADISRLYYRIIYEKQLLQSQENSLEISLYRLRLEEKKREVGSGNTLLYNQALIDYHADSASLVTRRMVIDDLIINLNQILGEKYSEARTINDESIELWGLQNDDELFAKALENNNQLRIAHLNEILAETAVRIEQSARYPQVSLFGNYSFASQSNEVGFIESSRAFGGQYGVRVRFNLYDGGRQLINVENSQLEQANSSLSRQDVTNSVEAAVASLINQYNSLNQRYNITSQSAEAARQSLDIARQQLELGAIGGFDFRLTQLAATNVENELLTIIHSMKQIEIDLARLTGQLPSRIL